MGRGKSKKTLAKEKLRERSLKMHAARGVGVGSRIPDESISEDWSIHGESRGTDGQTMISVETPTRSYRSFREAVDAEGCTSERHDLNGSSYAPSGEDISLAYESDGSNSDVDGTSESEFSDSETEEDTEEVFVPDWLRAVSEDILKSAEHGLFVGEISSVFDLVADINRTSGCASVLHCAG